MHAEIKHVRSVARGSIHDVSKVNHALCNKTGVLQEKEQCVSAKRHRTAYKIRHLDEYGRQGHCGPVVSAAEGVLCRRNPSD